MQVQRRAKGWEAVQVVSQGEGQGTRRLARGRKVSHIYLIYLSTIFLCVRFAVLTAATWPATSPPSAHTRPCPRGVTIARWRQSGTFDKLDYTLPNKTIFSL